jgi:hypothetical protein
LSISCCASGGSELKAIAGSSAMVEYWCSDGCRPVPYVEVVKGVME